MLVGYYMISSNISFDVGPNFFCPDFMQFYIMQCLTQMQLLYCSRTDCMNNLALLYFFISLAHDIHIFPGQMLIFSFTDNLTSFASSMEEQIIAVICPWVVMPYSLSCLFFKTSRLALEPTLSPVQRVLGVNLTS